MNDIEKRPRSNLLLLHVHVNLDSRLFGLEFFFNSFIFQCRSRGDWLTLTLRFVGRVGSKCNSASFERPSYMFPVVCKTYLGLMDTSVLLDAHAWILKMHVPWKNISAFGDLTSFDNEKLLLKMEETTVRSWATVKNKIVFTISHLNDDMFCIYIGEVWSDISVAPV